MGTTASTSRVCGGASAARARGRRFVRFAALLLVHALVEPAGAVVFVVTNANDVGVGSLRQAVLDANALPGPDEIAFNVAGCPCTVALSAPLVVTDELTITGPPGAAAFALNGGNTVRTLASTGVRLSVSDLTVRNGRDGSVGGAIIANGPLTLTRVTVRNSTAGTDGGGIYTNPGAPLQLVDCLIQANTATAGNGGGVYANDALTVSGTGFLDNLAPAVKGGGGGGGLIALAGAAISNTRFNGNSTGDWGGGAYLSNFVDTTPMTLDDVVFLGNTAQTGGGGGLFVWQQALLSAVEAIGNYAGHRGGGVYGSYAANYGLTLSGGRLLNNSAAGGGGLYADGDITVDGTELTGNVSRNGNGGGMWTTSSAVVSNAMVSGNVVLKGGNSGGIDTLGNLTLTSSTLTGNQNFGGNGGGSGSGGHSTVTDSEYVGNYTTGTGGALLVFGTATVTGTRFADNASESVGGAVRAQHAVVASSEFEGNEARENWGGGLFVHVTAALTDTDFTGNTSKFAGGAFAVQTGPAEVTGGRFEGNQTTTTGWGGAIYAQSAPLEIDGTEFEDNTAAQIGGAVMAGSSLSVSGALFQGNTAADDGGAIYAAQNLELDRTRCIDNEADRGGAVFQGGGGGSMTNALFARNRALSGLGEALALQPAGTQVVQHSTLVTHPTQAAGAAVWVNAGSVELRNNIVASHAQGVLRDAGAVTADYNLFHDNGADVQGDSIANDHALAGAPDFLDPDDDDYRLTIGSAALDAGPNVGAIADFEGDNRPQGAAFDLGYDELSLAAPTGCPASPAPSCGVASSDAIQIAVGPDPARYKFTLKHQRAVDAIAQTDFGDPLAGGNAYQLCLYDASAGAPVLLSSMMVPGGGLCAGKPCWKAIPGKGFAFKDGAATHAGIRQMTLRGGEAGKGALLVKGAGAALPLPGPKLEGISYLDADPEVTVQLHESSTGRCWQSHVTGDDVKTNTETVFKALRK